MQFTDLSLQLRDVVRTRVKFLISAGMSVLAGLEGSRTNFDEGLPD